MTEIIVFLITFTAAMLAVCMIVIAAAFVMYAKTYEKRKELDKMLKEGKL